MIALLNLTLSFSILDLLKKDFRFNFTKGKYWFCKPIHSKSSYYIIGIVKINPDSFIPESITIGISDSQDGEPEKDVHECRSLEEFEVMRKKLKERYLLEKA
ncbi:MAG TPA: hypothetical protein VGE63_00510 [Candidatus Paceibacterota bacterium]